MLTAEGRKWAADLIAAQVAGGWIVVSDGAGHSDVASIEVSVDEAEDGPSVVCRGTFGPEVGNFDWAKQSIKLSDGTVIDTTEEDQGRKAGGTWVAEIRLDPSAG